MPGYDFLWIDENTEHIAEHDVTTDEAEHVVEHAVGEEINDKGEPIAFGYTQRGRHLAVPYLFLDEQKTLVYVQTAYDTPPRVSRNRN